MGINETFDILNSHELNILLDSHRVSYLLAKMYLKAHDESANGFIRLDKSKDTKENYKKGDEEMNYQRAVIEETMGNRLNEFSSVSISTLPVGGTFFIGEEEFIVLEHHATHTKVITSGFPYAHQRFGDNSNWAKSDIRKLLNGEYCSKIEALVGKENIGHIRSDLTSLDGLDDYDHCIDKITLLSASDYAKYHKILGIKSNYPVWWWLLTPASTPSNEYSHDVCDIDSSGFMGWNSSTEESGVRPVMNLFNGINVLVRKIDE